MNPTNPGAAEPSVPDSTDSDETLIETTKPAAEPSASDKPGADPTDEVQSPTNPADPTLTPRPTETEATTDEVGSTVFENSPVLGLIGDLNNDGKIDSADARLVLRICARLDKTDALKNFLADVDANGKVVSFDARYLLRYAARLDLESKTAEANIGRAVVAVDGGSYATTEIASTAAAE